MVLHDETIYFLENPEEGVTSLATGAQLKYGSAIKDVFGIADINDLVMMVKHNKKFQESICKVNGVDEEDISLDMIFRVASKHDIEQMKDLVPNIEKEEETSVKE